MTYGKFYEKILGRKLSMKNYLTINAVGFGMGCVWLLCIYPTIVRPYLYPEEYKRRRMIIEQGLHRPQPPGGLREWTNPFEERTKQEPIILQRANSDKSSSS